MKNRLRRMMAAGLAVAMIFQSGAVHAVELTDDVEIIDVEEEGALTGEETEDDLVENIEGNEGEASNLYDREEENDLKNESE